MNSQPFVIDINDVNCADFSHSNTEHQFSSTNIWKDDNLEIVRLLNSINEKLETIQNYIIKNGRE